MPETKIMRLTVKALRREFPGADVRCQVAGTGHVHYFVDGDRVATGAFSPRVQERAIRAVVRDAVRYRRLPRGEP